MNKLTVLCFVALSASRVIAQESDPLAVTLPNGRVVHFQTDEQKAKFLAARERMAAAPTPAPTISPTPASAVSPNQTTPDTASHVTGRVNVNAPTFTADYYMLAPETWEGKQVMVSVAYLHRESGATRSDGLVELEAHTYGTLTATGEQRSGGELSIVATPPAAERILSLAGTRYQTGGWGTKTTMFKGVFKKSQVGSKGYFLYVDK